MATDPKTLEYRKEHNLCPRDGRSNKSGRKMCGYCLRKSAEKAERHRQKKKAKGLCLNCGQKVNNVNFCDKCKKNVAISSHKSHIKRYGLRKQSKVCVDCDDLAESDKTMCLNCLQKRSRNQSTQRHKRIVNNLCSQCGYDLGNSTGKRCPICIDKRNNWYQGSSTQIKDKIRRDDNRDAVIKHYGGKCIECGESKLTCLAIDHIKGGGNTHRRKIGKYGSGFFKWLIDNNFPDGFQILCHNCNVSKHLKRYME